MTVALVGAAAYCRCSIGRPATFLSSSISTNPRFHSYGLVTRSGVRFLSPWKGLKHLSISFRRNYTYLEKKGKPGKMAVYASLFGVGAPEALVIGVVALLIFGPKGLAEVARNLGKTLRSFQPTIKELQEVSREFKSTFEREIGLDEMTSTINNSAYRSNLVVKESQQDASDPNGRPTAESQELAEEPAAATKSQADSPEEQYLAAKTLESTASHSGPQETASVSPETTAQTRTEGDQDAKYG